MGRKLTRAKRVGAGWVRWVDWLRTMPVGVNRDLGGCRWVCGGRRVSGGGEWWTQMDSDRIGGACLGWDGTGRDGMGQDGMGWGWTE